MVKTRKKRVVKDEETKKVIITYAHIARGKVTYSSKNKFIAKSSVKKEGGKKLESIIHIIEKEKGNYSNFQEYNNKMREIYGDRLEKPIQVILKYRDKKSKEGKYPNAYDNLPIEIRTLSQDIQLYQKNIID